MVRWGMWFDIVIIVIVSTISMSLLARQFHIVAPPSPSPSGIPTKLEACAAAATVPVVRGSEHNDRCNGEKSFHLIPSAFRINGVVMGMSSEDMVACYGSPLSRDKPPFFRGSVYSPSN